MGLIFFSLQADGPITSWGKVGGGGGAYSAVVYKQLFTVCSSIRNITHIVHVYVFIYLFNLFHQMMWNTQQCRALI